MLWKSQGLGRERNSQGESLTFQVVDKEEWGGFLKHLVDMWRTGQIADREYADFEITGALTALDVMFHCQSHSFESSKSWKLKIVFIITLDSKLDLNLCEVVYNFNYLRLNVHAFFRNINEHHIVLVVA